jgi:hypothetical protein
MQASSSTPAVTTAVAKLLDLTHKRRQEIRPA